VTEVGCSTIEEARLFLSCGGGGHIVSFMFLAVLIEGYSLPFRGNCFPFVIG